MENIQRDIIAETVLQVNAERRKALLPWWIIVFSWIFLVFGAIVPIVLILGLFGYNMEMSLYGLETNDILSPVGIGLLLLYLLKGSTAFGLLKEKSWAVHLALLDAVTGIVICILLMSLPALYSNFETTIRLEIFALIPYLFKINKIKNEWQLRQPIVL